MRVAAMRFSSIALITNSGTNAVRCVLLKYMMNCCQGNYLTGAYTTAKIEQRHKVRLVNTLDLYVLITPLIASSPNKGTVL